MTETEKVLREIKAKVHELVETESEEFYKDFEDPIKRKQHLASQEAFIAVELMLTTAICKEINKNI